MSCQVKVRRAVARTVFKTQAPTVEESDDGNAYVDPQPPESPTEDRYAGLMVPGAKDGTVFHPDICSNNGRYQVGDKGKERKFDNYFEALEYLQKMQTACWRRPNKNGNWGGVKAIRWVRLER